MLTSPTSSGRRSSIPSRRATHRLSPQAWWLSSEPVYRFSSGMLSGPALHARCCRLLADVPRVCMQNKLPVTAEPGAWWPHRRCWLLRQSDAVTQDKAGPEDSVAAVCTKPAGLGLVVTLVSDVQQAAASLVLTLSSGHAEQAAQERGARGRGGHRGDAGPSLSLTLSCCALV